MREQLQRLCIRYAHAYVKGNVNASEATLDDLEIYVKAIVAKCGHPGMCEPSNRSRHCSCQCIMCKPNSGVSNEGSGS